MMISFGVAVFMYRPSSTAADTDVSEDHTFGFGEFLLVSI